MIVHAVTSSQIVSLSWRREAGNGGGADLGPLEVRFTRGQLYRYEGVPESVFLALLAENRRVEALPDGPPSVGRLFDRLVKKGGYPYRKIG